MFPPATFVKSSVKQESHLLLRSACIPVRSVASSTVEQKQVGHTIVQFVHARHLPATSSHRGCSKLSFSTCGRSRTSIFFVRDFAARETASRADLFSGSVASLCGTASRTSSPRGVPPEATK